jgi:hypothetical protein
VDIKSLKHSIWKTLKKDTEDGTEKEEEENEKIEETVSFQVCK